VRSATIESHRALIAAAARVLEREIEGDCGLDQLARHIGLSPFHFHRVFRAVIGEAPATYRRRLRLERAAMRLKYTGLPVIEIAFLAGYQSHEAFSRAFKSRFGRSPRAFRARAAAPLDGVGIDPAIERIEPRRVAVVRHVGPYDRIDLPLRRTVDWAGRRGLLDGATFLGIYWDDQEITPPERTRCEVGLYVGDRVADDGDRDVIVRDLPAGDYATFVHRGTPEERKRGYDLLLARWLPQRGRRPANAPAIEVYPPCRGGLDHLDWTCTQVYVPLVPTRAA
jgi:AraC family transcriptional regulator